MYMRRLTCDADSTNSPYKVTSTTTDIVVPSSSPELLLELDMVIDAFRAYGCGKGPGWGRPSVHS